MRFYIQNMTCGGCARSVAKAIQSVDSQAKVTADPPNRTIDVVSSRPRAELEAALARAGHPAANDR